jgi:hypothetical protein
LYTQKVTLYSKLCLVELFQILFGFLHLC